VELFFEPPPLTAVQKEAFLGVLCALSAAGGERFSGQTADGPMPSTGLPTHA
jgi:hypothetical protein